MKQKLLIVDDEKSILQSLDAVFSAEGFAVQTASSVSEALKFLGSKKREGVQADLLLLDVKLPDGSGLKLFEEIKKFQKDAKVIFMTAFGNVEQAVEAMLQGACDYVLKPFSVDELLLRVRRVLQSEDLKRQVQFMSAKAQQDLDSKYVRGPNSQMAKVYENLKVVATSPSTTVFVTGETGTGKEIMAQLIHDLSDRRNKPFVEVNATALTADLLESELFGHEAGSFTGATKTKKGLFEVATGGTLFLDEIGDMDLSMQAKILRALQERKIRRVGGTSFISVDLRLVTATNRNLEKAVADGEFREDLYYRLNVVPIYLPPLRKRKDDIASFVRHFLSVFSKEFGKSVTEVSPQALHTLEQYPWPGNVRELRNVVERAVLLECQGPILELEHLSFLNKSQSLASAEGSLGEKIREKVGQNIPLEMIEREHIEGVLRSNNGNKNQAAQILGIDRTTLYNKLKKYSAST